jgi:hypothetical protein
MIHHNLFRGIYTYYPKFLQRLADKTTVSPESSSFFCVSGSEGEPPRYRLREIRTVSRPQLAVRMWRVRTTHPAAAATLRRTAYAEAAITIVSAKAT